MNDNINVLNEIFKNTSMAISSIDKIEKDITCDKFLNVLRNQKSDYIKFNDSARQKIREYGKEPKDIGVFAKLSGDVGIFANTIMDKSTENFAKLMTEGSNMGVISLKRTLNDATSIDESVKRFADGLMALEEHSINNLKSYL